MSVAHAGRPLSAQAYCNRRGRPARRRVRRGRRSDVTLRHCHRTQRMARHPLLRAPWGPSRRSVRANARFPDDDGTESSVCFAMNRAKSSGLPGVIATPRSESFLAIAGWPSALFVSALSFATMSDGVLAGATQPPPHRPPRSRGCPPRSRLRVSGSGGHACRCRPRARAVAPPGRAQSTSAD